MSNLSKISNAAVNSDPACDLAADLDDLDRPLFRAISPGEVSLGDSEGVALLGTGRVLLIEDDSSFRAIVHDFLTQHGYAVVAAQSAPDGIREVLTGDFSLIFCDMTMPAMPGDMFYRAVERIRPQLCERFVFMTGDQDDARTSEFIKKAAAFVLRKPFPMTQLVDSIAFIEALGTFQSGGFAASPDLDAPASVVGGEAPIAAAESHEEGVPAAAGGMASEVGRVLLLTDDAPLTEIIRDRLAENGYSVVVVQNGKEGVHEVLGNDFTMVFCDFMMPGVPGHMFYRAVERVRPALCQRFVFLTGPETDVGADEFIKSVNGCVPRTDSPLKALLDSIAAADVHRTFRSVFDCAPTDPIVSRVSAPANEPRTGGISSPPAFSDGEAEWSARTPLFAAVADEDGAAEDGRERLLLIEDDVPFKDSIELLFTEHGYAVTAVKSAAEALDEVFARDYSVILCEIILPVLRGDTFYQVVEQVRPHLADRFVFMTGAQADTAITDFINELNSRVLVKPFPLNDLLGAVRVIENRKLPGELQDARPQEETGGPVDDRAPDADSADAFAPPPDETANGEDTPPPLDRVREFGDSAATCDAAGGGAVDEGGSPRAVVKGGERVLLIEDESAFKEIIEQFFTENGYAVTAVKSATEAINEVFASDYTIILCDMNLPAVPGDEFYRAVERTRPHLCERFVFMTGHRADPKIAEFIQRVNGHILLKPFGLNDLLNVVCAVETRRRFARGRPSAVLDETGAPVPEPAPDAPAGVVVPPPRAEPAPVGPRGKSAPSIFGTLLWVVPLVACAVIPAIWQFDLRTRAAAASAALRAGEEQWRITMPLLQKAEDKRHGIAAGVKRAKSMAGELDAPQLTQALRSIATAAGANVELWEIQVRAEPNAPGVWNLVIGGVSTGREPRATADRFRQVLEVNLQQVFAKEGVATRFEDLKDEEPSPAETLDEQNRRAAFTIIATVGWERLKVPAPTAGR